MLRVFDVFVEYLDNIMAQLWIVWMKSFNLYFYKITFLDFRIQYSL